MNDETTLDPFIRTIQHNCDIADASGSNIFSICGMALRLRDLNKWEKGLNPWEENDPAALLDWIDQKEKKWEKTEGQNFSALPLNGKPYDPFDTGAINKILSPLNLFYGAGYAHSLKPTFFLAKIKETRNLNGTGVLILGKELVRDLVNIPALNQDNAIIIRQQAARLFLWDQMAYIKKSGRPFLNFALAQCGLPDPGIENRKQHFESILQVQQRTYIYHEAGELNETVFDRKSFRKIIAEFPHTPVELLTRTLKDLLADTGPSGPLKQMISTRNVPGLGFYAAFQDGLFRNLFPQLRAAVKEFVSDKNWEKIEQTRLKGFKTARQYARDLTDIFHEAETRGDAGQAEEKINRLLVQPLLENRA